MPEISLHLLDTGSVDRASNILVKSRTTYHDLGYEEAAHHLTPKLRIDLEVSIQTGPVVVVGSRQNGIIAAYQLPNFHRNGREIFSDDVGYFAADPEGQGIGHEVLSALEKIFSRTAFIEGMQSLVHNETTRRKSTLFEDKGYRLLGTHDVQRWVFHNYSKVFAASDASLNPDEERIASEIARRTL